MKPSCWPQVFGRRRGQDSCFESAIQEGINSSVAKNINPKSILKVYKPEKKERATYFLATGRQQKTLLWFRSTLMKPVRKPADTDYELIRLALLHPLFHIPEPGKNYVQADTLCDRVVQADDAEILSILHQRMDLKKKLMDRAAQEAYGCNQGSYRRLTHQLQMI